MVTWNLCEGAYIDNTNMDEIISISLFMKICIIITLSGVLLTYHIIIKIMVKKAYSESKINNNSPSKFNLVNNTCIYSHCHVPLKMKKM